MTDVPAVRIGLLGYGRIARSVHLPLLRRLPGARLVAIAESDDRNRAEAAAAAPGTAVFPDYRDLLASVNLDAAVICLPPSLHAPAATAAFNGGLHGYVEKPLAASLDEATGVLAAWRRAGTVGMVGFNFRFHPQIQEMRKLLRKGAVGTPLAVRTVFSILPHGLPEWKRTRMTGGGVLLDLASHHVDLVRYLFAEEVTRALALVRSLEGQGDHAALQLEIPSGLLVQSLVSLGSVEEHRVEIFGTAGKLVMDRTELLHAGFERATQRGPRLRRLGRTMAALHPRRLVRSPGAEPSYARALSAFVGACSGRAFEGADLLDGARCLAVIEAAERSVLTGAATAPVAVELPGA